MIGFEETTCIQAVVMIVLQKWQPWIPITDALCVEEQWEIIVSSELGRYVIACIQNDDQLDPSKLATYGVSLNTPSYASPSSSLSSGSSFSSLSSSSSMSSAAVNGSCQTHNQPILSIDESCEQMESKEEAIHSVAHNRTSSGSIAHDRRSSGSAAVAATLPEYDVPRSG